MKTEVAELDETRMTAESRQFAAELFSRFPELRPYAAMERAFGDPEWSVVVTVPAPSGDVDAHLVIWVDNGREPSVAFGRWHTHESVWAIGEDGESHASLLDLVAGIFAERFVLCEDVGREGDGSSTILDLTVRDAILEELTSKYSPGRARLRSWTGKRDRTVDVDSLESDGSA